MKHGCQILICLVAANVLALFPCSPRAQAVPDEALRAANDYLQSMIAGAQRDNTYLQRHWHTDIVKDYSDLWLAEPYARYIMQAKDICDFAGSEESEFASTATFMYFSFPVMYGDEYVKTFNIGFRDDAWKHTGGHGPIGRPLDLWIIRLREHYPSKDGYRISTVRTNGIGNYLLLYANDKLVKIAPAVPMPAHVMGVESNEDGFGPLVSVERATQFLRATAKEYKSRRAAAGTPVRNEKVRYMRESNESSSHTPP